MGKKGQITLFIILGIVIAAVVILAVVFRGEISKLDQESQQAKLSTLPTDVQPVEDDFQACTKKTLEEGIWLMGMQGGYITAHPGVKAFGLGNFTIAYNSDYGTNKVPSIPTMEKDLEEYMKAFIPECFKPEEYAKLDVFLWTLAPKVSITNSTVSSITDHKITISQESTEYRLTKPYKASVPVRLGMIQNIVAKTVANEIKNESIDLEYLAGTELKVDILTIEENIILYIITDEQSKVRNENYSYFFMSRFGK
jgi:hypothetical protein